MQLSRRLGLYLFIFTSSLAACGDDGDSCDFAAQTGCSGGQVCEIVAGANPMCFAPLVVAGQVSDLSNQATLEGARVVALDINGAPISSVAISMIDGTYSLQIPSERSDKEGTIEPVELTLRADAQGFQSFPSGLRQALPIDISNAELSDKQRLVQSSLTDIGLIPLPPGAGTGSVSGTVEVPNDGVGILVVAEGTGQTQVAIANRVGEYQIFNVSAGSQSISAYALNHNYQRVDVSVSDASDTTADLLLSSEQTGTVEGSVQIVNAPGGAMTSVILVVESTFEEAIGRGQTIPGMRDPAPGIAPNLTGDYSISGVPPGRYVVLAAFENDDLVRDPDISIGGTSTLHIEVSPGNTTTVDGFKVTEALAIVSPGANGPEEIAGTPTFRWEDDSSEDEYKVEVFNAFGEVIWDTSIGGSSGQDPSVLYEGPALQSGSYYQFRATSFRGAALSRTEELKGVFFVQ